MRYLKSVLLLFTLVFASAIGMFAETGSLPDNDPDRLEIGHCCQGRVGDVNGSGGDEPTIGDAVDIALFLCHKGGPPECLEEADINQSGGTDPTEDDITIGDVAYLQDYLFITGPSLGLPDCL